MIDLLQISDSLNKVAGLLNGDSNSDGSISFMELLVMGGWVMIPLALMLLLVVYVFAERYIAIRNASNIDQNFMNIIRDHIVSGNVLRQEVLQKTPITLLQESLTKDSTYRQTNRYIEKSMDNVGQLEMYKLGKEPGHSFCGFKGSANFWFCGNADRFDAIVCQYSKSE